MESWARIDDHQTSQSLLVPPPTQLVSWDVKTVRLLVHTNLIAVVFVCESLEFDLISISGYCPAPGSYPPGFYLMLLITCQPGLIRGWQMETRNGDETDCCVSLCVHELWVTWVRKLFVKGLFQVELSSSKSLGRVGSFLGSLRSSSFFLTRFLLVLRQSTSSPSERYTPPLFTKYPPLRRQ